MGALLRTTAARIRGFLRPDDLESDFDQELATHLEMAEEAGVRRGLSLEEARRAARMQLGGIAQLRESRREAWGLPWLDGFVLDAKLGSRMLRRSWGLTLAGGLAMTIVITIAAVAFVFLDEFMGRSAPPIDEGERVVALQSWDVEAHRRRDVSRRDLERWTATLHSVRDLGAFQTMERRLMVTNRPAEWVRVAEITASGFELARVQPLLGRWIGAADERVGAEPVMVIGYEVWQSRFASDPAVIGQTVRLGEVMHTVVRRDAGGLRVSGEPPLLDCDATGSRPTTTLDAPARNATARASIPVPHATSSTRWPGRIRAASATRAGHCPNSAGTINASYALAASI